MSDQDKRDGYKDAVSDGMTFMNAVTLAVRGNDYHEGFENGQVERERQKSDKDK